MNNDKEHTLNIKNIDDRKTFEETRLIPALKCMYCGIFGKDTPVITGSTSLYIQGIYLYDFPTDIDIKFQEEKKDYNKFIIYSNIIRKFGFTIDWTVANLVNKKQIKEIEYNGINILVEDADYIINELNPLYIEHYSETKPKKVEKKYKQMKHIKENYPEYFDEKNNKYLENFS